MAEIVTRIKDPDATKDYSVDWSRWLLGDEITASSWIVAAPLVVENEGFTATKATAFISGGVVSRTYRVTNRIETAGGRKADRSINLLIKEE